jgi:hypothetical protein
MAAAGMVSRAGRDVLVVCRDGLWGMVPSVPIRKPLSAAHCLASDVSGCQRVAVISARGWWAHAMRMASAMRSAAPRSLHGKLDKHGASELVDGVPLGNSVSWCERAAPPGTPGRRWHHPQDPALPPDTTSGSVGRPLARLPARIGLDDAGRWTSSTSTAQCRLPGCTWRSPSGRTLGMST